MNPWTAADFATALRVRHPSDKGWLVLDEVANDQGGGWADVVAIHTWHPAYVVGFEIKVSRSDWLHETAQPGKRAWIEKTCRFRWFVAPPGLIMPAELPDGWGLLERSGERLRRKVAAPSRKVPDIPRWLARQVFLLSDRLRTTRIEMASLRSLLDDDVRKAVLEAERKERDEERMYIDAYREDAARGQADVNKAWAAIAQGCGIGTQWNRQAPHVAVRDAIEMMRREATRSVHEHAARALHACEALVKAVESQLPRTEVRGLEKN